MKINILIFLFFSIILSVSAQSQKVQVFLKNGSIVNGKLIETWSPDNIKVESNNTIWVFNDSEVDTVIVGKVLEKQKSVEIPYHINVEYGLLIGNSDNEDNAAGFFHSSFNYNLVHNFYAGAGAGVEYYMEQSYIPAFVQFEYRFRQTKFSPLIFLKSGYLIPGEKQHSSEIYNQYESRNIPTKYLDAEGGIFVNPGFGFSSWVGENFGLCFSVGYRFHTLGFTGKDEYELDYRYNRLSISLGLTFK